MSAHPALTQERAGEQARAADAGPPATAPEGATTLDTPQAYVAWQTGAAIFIDVLPRPPRPAGLPADALWRNPKRRDIPGSLWLADTGHAELSPAALAYFANGLATATANDKGRRLIIYCRPDCWASWHAARRALSLGYTRVSWYPGGADAWDAAGHPLEERLPAPDR